MCGTELPFGQVLRLVGLPAVIRRDGWAVRPADRVAGALLGCRLGTPVLRRRMLVLVDECPVAVTEEAFCAARRGVGGRVRRSRHRPGSMVAGVLAAVLGVAVDELRAAHAVSRAGLLAR